ncbi:Gti1/Pac2 family-domain-containing protein, partial [Armillaria borealis]
DVEPFYGYVETAVNALHLIHAAQQRVIPHITRRLNDSEQWDIIKSGSVFVFSVEESGIKRWTDGLLWPLSRIVGNFLVYREISKQLWRSQPRSLMHRTSPSQSSIRYKPSSPNGTTGDHGTFKPNGLVKKTIMVTIDGSDLHLISYYTTEDIHSGKLKSLTDIMSLHMPPHLFRLMNFRVPPKVELGLDGKARLV